ncbi:helix-turn-helix transcriptional regulator [Gordonia sp. NPDC003424]
MATKSRARTRYLSLQDVAAELGVSDRTIRRYIADGKLSAFRPSTRTIRIDPAELDRFISQGGVA